MHQNAILKIKSLLLQGIERESDLAYLLICIRKIIEGDSQWKRLKFYCDWIVHSHLSGPEAQIILSAFSASHLSLMNGEEFLPQEINDICNFRGLVEELESFFASRNIVSHVSTNTNWSKFIWLYVSIIEGCPLKISNTISPRDETKKVIAQAESHAHKIKKVTVQAELAKEIRSGQQYYKVSWSVTDSTRKSGEMFAVNGFDV